MHPCLTVGCIATSLYFCSAVRLFFNHYNPVSKFGLDPAPPSPQGFLPSVSFCHPSFLLAPLRTISLSIFHCCPPLASFCPAPSLLHLLPCSPASSLLFPLLSLFLPLNPYPPPPGPPCPCAIFFEPARFTPQPNGWTTNPAIHACIEDFVLKRRTPAYPRKRIHSAFVAHTPPPPNARK